MKTIYDTDFIIQHLPQQLPLLMIDRVIEYKPHRQIKTLKNVTVTESYFQGHFPDKKIMPGVLICESIAQSISLFNILNKSQDPQNDKEDRDQKMQIPVLASVDIKFIDMVTPGDQLLLSIKAGREFKGMRSYNVEATVDQRIVAKGTQFTALREE